MTSGASCTYSKACPVPQPSARVLPVTLCITVSRTHPSLPMAVCPAQSWPSSCVTGHLLPEQDLEEGAGSSVPQKGPGFSEGMQWAARNTSQRNLQQSGSYNTSHQQGHRHG